VRTLYTGYQKLAVYVGHKLKAHKSVIYDFSKVAWLLIIFFQDFKSLIQKKGEANLSTSSRMKNIMEYAALTPDIISTSQP